MGYSAAAVERAMTVHPALLHALHGHQPWLQVADVIGLSPRTVRRWRARLEQYGVSGLLDRRRRTPSPRRVPLAELQRVLRLYRERYQGFNVRHFHQLARRDHAVTFSRSRGMFDRVHPSPVGSARSSRAQACLLVQPARIW